MGQACAIAAAREGANVVVTDLPQVSCDETLATIKALGAKAAHCPLDVTDSAQVQAAIQFVVDTYGRLDIALNNAGISGGGAQPLDQMTDTAFDQIQRVNLYGVFYCMKYELQQLLAQGGGTIVNMSSAAGITGAPGAGAYAASKHGVIGLTKSSALEYGSRGIRVVAICPYFTDTAMVGALTEQDLKRRLGMSPAKRLGRPEEVANAFIYLGSDEASYTNGSYIVLDGGALA